MGGLCLASICGNVDIIVRVHKGRFGLQSIGACFCDLAEVHREGYAV